MYSCAYCGVKSKKVIQAIYSSGVSAFLCGVGCLKHYSLLGATTAVSLVSMVWIEYTAPHIAPTISQLKKNLPSLRILPRCYGVEGYLSVTDRLEEYSAAFEHVVQSKEDFKSQLTHRLQRLSVGLPKLTAKQALVYEYIVYNPGLNMTAIHVGVFGRKNWLKQETAAVIRRLEKKGIVARVRPARQGSRPNERIVFPV
jgi:hypothetical protein